MGNGNNSEYDFTVTEWLDIQMFEQKVKTLSKDEAISYLVEFYKYHKNREKFYNKQLKEHWGL